MDAKKRKKLEAAGYKVGSVAEFLGLTTAEAAIVETRLALAKAVRLARMEAKLTQAELGRSIGSTQSRVAKIEAADAGVSADLMLRALYATGAKPAQVLSRKVVRHEPIPFQLSA